VAVPQYSLVCPGRTTLLEPLGKAQTLCCLAVVRFSIPLGAVSRREDSRAFNTSPTGGASVDGRKRDANLLLWAAAQPHPAATSRTGRAFVDELDSSSLQRGHNPRQTFDHPTDGAVAGFHSLNRRERYPRCFRQSFLLHAHKYPRRFHLGCSEQCSSPTQIDDMSGRSDLPDGSRIIPDLQIMSPTSRLQSSPFR
jgi:hypothetical protein